MNYRDLLRRYSDGTEPPTDLSRRVRGRPEAPPDRRGWVLAGVFAATLLVGVLHFAEPAPVARDFVGFGEAALGDAVQVRWNGSGTVDGDSRQMQLVWEQGVTDVEVTPGAGVHLGITTGEAHIVVIGTGFVVNRDALGTGVDVRHGLVEVTCLGDANTPRRLGAGESTLCLPVTPAALLGRARAQQRRGDSPAEVLVTLDAARPRAAGDTAAELDLLRAYELGRAGQREEALRVAEAALNGNPLRRNELLRLLTRLAWDLGGCARARPYANALAALGETTPCPPESP